MRARCAAATPRPRQRIREQVLANLDAFLKLSLDLDGGRCRACRSLSTSCRKFGAATRTRAPTRAAWAEGVEDGEAEPEDDGESQLDALHILTVHAAKGLEAPFVVLLDANHSDPAADRGGILVDWPPESPLPPAFLGLRQAQRARPGPPALFEAEAALAERENWNLLYVAMTRAQQGLLVSGVKGRASKAEKRARRPRSRVAGTCDWRRQAWAKRWTATRKPKLPRRCRADASERARALRGLPPALSRRGATPATLTNR